MICSAVSCNVSAIGITLVHSSVFCKMHACCVPCSQSQSHRHTELLVFFLLYAGVYIIIIKMQQQVTSSVVARCKRLIESERGRL